MLRERNSTGDIANDYFDKISFESKLALIKFFRTVLHNETKMENMKQILFKENGNVSNYDLFESIFQDLNEKFVSKGNLKNFMKENEFCLNKFELDILYSRLDFDKDGKISINDFMKEIPDT
jgi:hypothetical protein